MKPLTLLLALAALGLLQIHGQDMQAGKASLQSKSEKKGAQLITTREPKQPLKPVESRVTYGGLLADLSAKRKPDKVLTQQPAAVKIAADSANLYTDPVTGKIRGFVLFAIKF